MKYVAPVLVALLVTTSSCGFLFTHAPPTGYEDMDYFTCTENDLGPGFDLVWAGINLLVFSLVAKDADDVGQSTPVLVISGAQVGIWTTSALVGFSKIDRCKTAKRELASRQPDARERRRAAVEAIIVELGKSTLEIGETAQLRASSYNPSGATLAEKAFVWSTSNSAVASVNSAGQVAAHAAGEVVVTAETENRVGTATIVVSAP